MIEKGSEIPVWPPLIWLASRSPRRRLLLTEAGLRHVAEHPGLEDSELLPGRVSPAEWVAALAYLKAAAGLEIARAKCDEPILVLGSDTACVHDGRLVGTPRDAEEARGMMESFRNGAHEVLTGVALIALAPEREPLPAHRSLFVSRAFVTWGNVTNEGIESYIESGQWQGKAGGYNLRERTEAGWPIACEGDPTGVMGLPIDALNRKLSVLRPMWSDMFGRSVSSRRRGMTAGGR